MALAKVPAALWWMQKKGMLSIEFFDLILRYDEVNYLTGIYSGDLVNTYSEK